MDNTRMDKKLAESSEHFRQQEKTRRLQKMEEYKEDILACMVACRSHKQAEGMLQHLQSLFRGLDGIQYHGTRNHAIADLTRD